MSAIDRFQNELEQLSSLLRPLEQETLEEWSPEWMNRQSLLTRDIQVRRDLAIAEGRFELEFTLLGQRVQGETVDVSFLGKFLEELQATVTAVSDFVLFGLREGKSGTYPGNVVNASSMMMVARPGSFTVALEGPRRGAQGSFDLPDPSVSIPAFDDAIGRILDVIDVAENEVTGESLPLAVSELGGHRPLLHMIELAKLLASNSTSAVAIERSPFKSEPRQSLLSASGARRLQTLLSRTQQSSEIMELDGMLTGVRWKSGIFDFEPSDQSEPITGKIASELRDAIRPVFDRPARVTIEKTITETAVREESTVTYKM